MTPIVSEALELSERVAEGAGGLARAAFGSELAIVAKTSQLDVVTEIDHAAERLIVAGIRDRFPDHGIFGEEGTLVSPSGPWTWLIDPLDGTNNLAIGLPLYGLSIVLLYEGNAVMGLIRDSHIGRQLAVTAQGDIHPVGGVRIRPPSAAATHTVALQQGYGVSRDDIVLASVRHRMESTFGRVLYTWSPSIDTLLLACGAIGGIVGYQCVGAEHVAARFVAARIGCDVECIPPSMPLSEPATYVVAWPGTTTTLTGLLPDE